MPLKSPKRLYKLTDDLRLRLKEPLGKLFNDEKILSEEFIDIIRDCKLLVSVGDRSTERLISMGIIPKIQIVDGKEQRIKRPLPQGEYKLIKCFNPAGYISSSSIISYKRALKGKKPVRILVDGEEDLLTLLALYFSPKGSVVIYGQPNKGMVIVKVDLKIQRMSLSFLKRMGLKLKDEDKS
ncbi:MAG: DUF359 domain-containing protein [Nitrososphaerales archaeon]